MARLSERHRKTLNGVGKCSVPMWSGGLPAGFCDKPAYSEQLPSPMFRDGYTGQTFRQDGKYSGLVSGLCCPDHGGASEPNHTMECNTCGEDFDMRNLDEVLAHEVCQPTLKARIER